MTTINYSSTSKFSECRVRGWEPKQDVVLTKMRFYKNEDCRNEDCLEDCRNHCKNLPECISWSMSNGTDNDTVCRYSQVELNVSNVIRTNIETDWVGLKEGNKIKFIPTSILLDKKY